MSISTKECAVCKGLFPVKPYRLKEAKYCSYDCYWGRSEMLASKICAVCGLSLAAGCFSKRNRGFESRCRNCKLKEWKNWARRNTAKQRFSFYVSKAKSRNHEFSLTQDEFTALVECGECFYCGGSARLGLDRVDSSSGYTSGNVVPCCRRCNVAKNDMSREEFIKLCTDVAKRHGAA